jgi:hypothetical protein
MTERIAIFMALCSLFGCYGSELSGQVDANEEHSPDMDSFTDTRLDIDPEAWPDFDPDIGDILDVGDFLVYDTAYDPTFDPFYDAPASICSVIDQTGCPMGTWCSWALDEMSCLYYESCFPGPPGDLGIGDECSADSHNSCMPGTECWFIWGMEPPEICREWCRTDEDCSLPGARCGLPTNHIPALGPCAGLILGFPYQLCTEP